MFSDVDVDLHDDVDDDVHRPRFSPALTDSRQKVIKSYKVSHYLPLFAALDLAGAVAADGLVAAVDAAHAGAASFRFSVQVVQIVPPR